MSDCPGSRPLLLPAEQLMDSEAIDDEEFAIPQVDTPPTLESILNEPEDEVESFILEDTIILNAEDSDVHVCETSSLGSSDSGDCAHFNRTGRRKTTVTEASTHGSILRHSLLKGISAQIVSAADKVDAGLPTAITVSSVVAVGTSHGLVLVFDHNQALQLCLGSTGTGSEYGAVSALSINHDCTRLLCGFANGQITMWDLANGKLLRTITDAHPPGAAILHVKFMDNPTVAVCNDSGGSVFELSFRRIMGIRTCESRCLFSGSKGEVCCIEPLYTGAEMKDHPVTQYSLLAMASLTKVLLVGLKPSLKVWMTFPYGKTDPASVPLLAWQFVVVQKAINPVLAFCRGNVIYFLLIKRDELGTMHVIKQRELHLSCDIISLSWVNSHTLVLMDSLERLRVVDRPSQEELEILDMSECQLVYNSSHFKSLATGGNVSQALALVGERACYQSICCYGGEVVYLGTKSVQIIILRKWWERVDHLLKQEKFKEALSLAWSFSEGTAKAVLGLFADSNKTKAVISSKMVEILLQYVEFCLKKCPEQGKIIMEQQFQDRIPVIVEYCLLLQRIDLLCNQIYSRLVENPAAKGVFLKSLEPYILSDRIGCLSVNVMRDLLSYFRENNMMESVERCLVHMDITNLDIQQVVQMCWDHQLYDAMIYVFNRGMNDYISPMEKLFQAIGPIQHKGSALTDEHIAVGNKLLVYISCCLAGRAYPLGDIPQDLVHQVKYQVFEFLVCVHSMEAVPEEEMFPFIRTLLYFDTQEFLNVLALTFEDFKNDKQAVEFQQRIVDILLKIMVNSSDFSQSQVGCLFTFLARQLAKPDNTLFINRKLFDQVLEFLCTPNDSSRHAERQQVLLELLQVVGVVQIDETHLLDLAEKAEFYQICEYLYGKRRLYDKIIDCFLKDSLRKEDVFSFLHNVLSSSDYSSQEKSSVSDKTLQHFKDLVCINSAKTAELVTLHFADEVPFIINSIQDDQLIFHFLKCLLNSRSMSPQGVVGVGPEVHELLVNLTCQFRPQDVSAFLKTSQDYRMEETIQITKERGVHEATAYLLEKKGDFLGAFEVMLQILTDRLRKLVLKRSEVQLRDPPSCEDSEKRVEFQRAEEVVHDVIGLCQRSSECLNQEQRETLWFSLLELVLSPEKTVKGASATNTSEDLKVLTMRILNSMSSFIPPHAIVHRILQDPVYGKGKLSEIQSLILGMLESFSYEETLLQTTTSLLNSDLHWSLSQLRKVVSKGLNPRQDHCNVCLQLYKKCHEREEDVFLFSCGHLYHCHCLEQKDQEVFSKRMLSRSCHKCKCSPSSRGTEQGQSAQTKATSSKCEVKSRVRCRKSKQRCSEASADAPQAQAWHQLCSLYRGPSRISILTELSDGLERDGVINPFTRGAGHVPHRENLQLKLSALPLLED